MIVQANLVFARLNTFFCQRLSTGTRVVQLLDDIQHGIHRSDVRVGAIVCAEFLVDGTCLEDTGKQLVRDTDAGVGLSVFQQDVISGVVFLDKSVL